MASDDKTKKEGGAGGTPPATSLSPPPAQAAGGVDPTGETSLSQPMLDTAKQIAELVEAKAKLERDAADAKKEAATVRGLAQQERAKQEKLLAAKDAEVKQAKANEDELTKRIATLTNGDEIATVRKENNELKAELATGKDAVAKLNKERKIWGRGLIASNLALVAALLIVLFLKPCSGDGGVSHDKYTSMVKDNRAYQQTLGHLGVRVNETLVHPPTKKTGTATLAMSVVGASGMVYSTGSFPVEYQVANYEGVKTLEVPNGQTRTLARGAGDDNDLDEWAAAALLIVTCTKEEAPPPAKTTVAASPTRGGSRGGVKRSKDAGVSDSGQVVVEVFRGLDYVSDPRDGGVAADAGEAPHQPLPSVPDREAVRYRKCGDPSLTYAEQSVCCRGEANEVIASETDARLRAELGIKKFGSCMVFSSAVKANASKP